MKHDTALFNLITAEHKRQEDSLTLIASENYASLAVLQAAGSVLTNKYAEGYPGKRYYAGCEVVDKVEALAIERCNTLFQVPHSNVQPHAGSQANLAVYFAFLKPGDTIMGMSLTSGGHLTHGHPVNLSGNWFNAVAYDVDKETEQFDFKAIQELADRHKPKIIVVGASAYSRTIDFEKFAAVAQSCNALLLADIAHIAGLVAAGLHPNPYPWADVITSTTHKTLRGPRGGLIMCKAEHAAAIDRAVFPGTQGGPCMNIIAAKAVAFGEALQPSFKTYQASVIRNAQVMAATFEGLGYRIVAGGTDNHLFLVDLRAHQVTGLAAQLALEKVGLNVSRSTIPFDTSRPWIGSGIRIGTPAITTRGLDETHIEQLAHLIHEVVINHDKETVLESIAEQVRQLSHQFPVYTTE